MKIAVLTDVHGDLPGLDAALMAIREEGCSAVYHTGDAIAIGPYPAECVERLLSTPGIHLVMGNHEAYAADLLAHDEAAGMEAEEVIHQRWVRSQLGPLHIRAISQLPWLLEAEINGLRIAFLHYAMGDSGHDFVRLMHGPEASALDAMFGRYHADLVFFGHDHSASDTWGAGRYINPGSLGCFDRPVARFVILEVNGDRTYSITPRAVGYDDSDLLRAFDQRDVPARGFIRRAFVRRQATAASK
jgi:predicted phosphodiesterase